jgi:hypothetical protein
MEFTRDALAVAKAYMDLPANERALFRTAITARAAAWDASEGLDSPPRPWPIVVKVEQDPAVQPESY